MDKELPSFVIGNEIGKLKLEYEIAKAVFIAPKVYALVTVDGKEIIKIKGLTEDAQKYVKFRDLASLLVKDNNKVLTHEKWLKNCFTGTITVKEIAYTLKATSNKRELIYIDGVLSDTCPLKYERVSKNYAKASFRKMAYIM